ncbi:MAG: hypothetical protein WAL84_00630, partial [Candidatus Dormiibacterota bacterium]
LTDLLAVVDIHTGPRPVDPQWLDALLAKSADVSADLVVAVSTAGFSDGARRLGEHARVRLWTVTRPDLRRHSLFFDERLPSHSLIRLVSGGLQPLVERHDAEALLQSGDPVELGIDGHANVSALTAAYRHISTGDPMIVEPQIHEGKPRLDVEALLLMPRRSGLALQVRAGDRSANVVAGYLTMVVEEDHTFAFDRNLEWTSADSGIVHLASSTREGDLYVNTAGRHPFLGICVRDPGVPLLSTPKRAKAEANQRVASVRIFVDPAGVLHTTTPDAPISSVTSSKAVEWITSQDLVALTDFTASPSLPDPGESAAGA